MAAEENLFVLVEQSPDHAGTLDRLKSKISGEGDQRASPASSSSKLKCPRVPKKLLLDVKAQAHNVPKRISLGPYHHGNPRLSGGETLKLKLADDFITWCEWSVEEIYSSICIHVRELKDCYEEETAKKFRDDVFTEMMLVDGCALLWYIICVCEGYDHEDYDIRYQDLCLLHQDALLLENQLPYPVLQQLMKLLDLSPESWTLIFQEFFGMIEESSFQEFFGIKQKPFLQRMKDYCCRLFLPLIRNIKGNPEPKPKEELEPNLEEESQPKTVSAKLDSNFRAYQDVRVKIRKHLKSHYNSKLKRWMTQCLDTYFGSPWTIIAWIAAALALFLTAIQTYFSAFSR